MSESQTKTAPATETVTVKPGKSHVHQRVHYDGDAKDEAKRTFTCRSAQAKRLRAAGVVH